MKTTLCLFLFIVMSVTVCSASEPQAGRYQVFQAKMPTASYEPDGSVNQSAGDEGTYRLDTATGEICSYQLVMDSQTKKGYLIQVLSCQPKIQITGFYGPGTALPALKLPAKPR